MPALSGIVLLIVIALIIINWAYIVLFLTVLAVIGCLLTCNDYLKARAVLEYQHQLMEVEQGRAEEQAKAQKDDAERRRREAEAQQRVRAEAQAKAEEQRQRQQDEDWERQRNTKRERQTYDYAYAGTQKCADCYEVLKLSMGCTKDQARVAYRELSKSYHPDKVAHLAAEFKALAEERMKEINSAYDELKRINGW